MRSLCTALFVSLFLATATHAAPAVVKVFEAQAHAQPDAASPVLHTFVEKAEVSVSEEAEAGWRRVRLPDGSVGYIQESALRLVTAEAAPAVDKPSAAADTVPAPATPATPPVAADRPVRDTATPSPKIYVKDLEHLADLVKEDAIVGSKAQVLTDRKTAAGVVLGTGIAAGVLLNVLAFTTMAEKECMTFRDEQDCRNFPNLGMSMGGIGTMVASGFLYALIAPNGGHVLDVINEWNTRHPERPFALTGSDAPPSL